MCEKSDIFQIMLLKLEIDEWEEKTKHTQMSVYVFELYLSFPSNFSAIISSSSIEKREYCSNGEHLWNWSRIFKYI